MLKLSLDNLDVVSYEPLPDESVDAVATTHYCPEPTTRAVGCPTSTCTGTVQCTTGGTYAC